jgi:hypothetical protein
MTDAYLAERRAEALHYLRPDVEATPSQRLTAWLFLKQDRKRQQEAA